MLSRRSVAVVLSQFLLAGMILGCQPTPPKPAPLPPPPATPDVVGSLQAELQTHDHDARAGTVSEVRPGNSLAAITLIPENGSATSIKVGDTITFLTSTNKPIANGSVVSVDKEVIVAKFVPTPDGHAPAEGDIAVRLSSPK